MSAIGKIYVRLLPISFMHPSCRLTPRKFFGRFSSGKTCSNRSIKIFGVHSAIAVWPDNIDPRPVSSINLKCRDFYSHVHRYQLFRFYDDIRLLKFIPSNRAEYDINETDQEGYSEAALKLGSIRRKGVD